jgi:uncharacterized membrane protein YbhN (UPF0104 family)
VAELAVKKAWFRQTWFRQTWLRSLIATALAVVLLYFALRGVDWRNMGHTVAAADWRYLCMALALSAFAALLRSLRWRILLNAEADIPVATVFWATMAGYLGNLVLPARAGELVRTFLISGRSMLSRTYVLTTALGERLSDAIALVLFSSLALLAVDSTPAWMAGMARLMTAAAVGGALGIALLPRFEGLLRRLLKPFPGFVLNLVDQVILGVRSFHSLSRFAGFAALTLVIWSVDTCGAWIAAHALNLPVTLPVALLFISGLGLGSALPSTPGYVGIYQFVAVSVLGPFGIARDAAIAYVIVIQAVNSVSILGFGSVGLLRLGARLSDVTDKT